MASWRRGTVIAAAAALVVTGFGAGFGAARIGAPHAAVGAGPVQDGFTWPFFGKPRDAKAPRAAPKKPDGFGVWTSRLDTSRADPQACIRMSRELDPRRSYGDFVAVSPDLGRPAAVTVAGDELCVAGVGYEPRKITLLHGLPARSGEVLTQDVEVAFDQAEKPSYVGFAGSGVILPREDADGIGIETVNVSSLQVELWRVPDRNLVRKEIGAPEPTPEGGYEYDGGESGVGDDGRKVWEGRLAVQGKTDERAVTVFPFGAALKTLEPGAYVIKATDASGLKGERGKKGEGEGPTPASARRWVMFTDMALQAYHGSDGLDVTVRSLKTAQAMRGVRLALVGKDGKDLAAASSDAEGRARFDRAVLAGEAGASPARIMAYGRAGDFVSMDLSRSPVDLSKQDVGGRTPPGAGAKTGKSAQEAAAAVDGFVYADRGVYRPGETVHLTALLRDRLARAVKDRSGALVIRRPSGPEFRRIRFVASPNGAVAADLALPASSPRGRWRATLEMDGSDASSGEVAFQVENFAPQRLAVSLGAAAERPVVAGEQRPIGIDSKFLYGAPASGLPVQAEARIVADADPFPAYADFAWGDQQTPFAEKLSPSPATTTDGAGHAVTTLDASAVQGATQPLLANFSASVFEPGGRPVAETAKLKTAPEAALSGGEDHRRRFRRQAGADVRGDRRRSLRPPHRRGREVSYLLVAEKWDYEWFESGGRWSWRRTSRDIPIARGQLAVSAGAPARFSRALPWGDYRVIVEHPLTGAKTVIRQSSGWSEPVEGVEAPDTARVSPVKAGYRTGDTVQVRIQAPFEGEAQVAVATDRLLALKSVHVPAGGAVVSLKADASWAGGRLCARQRRAAARPQRQHQAPPGPGRRLRSPRDSRPQADRGRLRAGEIRQQGAGGRAPAGEGAEDRPAGARDPGGGGRRHPAPDPPGQPRPRRLVFRQARAEPRLSRRLRPPARPEPGRRRLHQLRGGRNGRRGADRHAHQNRGPVVGRGGHRARRQGRGAPAPSPRVQRQSCASWPWPGPTRPWVPASPASSCASRWWPSCRCRASSPPATTPGRRWSWHNVEARVGAYLAELTGRGGVLAPFRKLYQLALGQRVVDRTEIVGSPTPGVGRVDLKVSGPGFSTAKSYPIETRLGWGPITRATTAPAAARRGVHADARSPRRSVSRGRAVHDGELFAVPRLRPGADRRLPVALSLRLQRAAGLGRLPAPLRRRDGDRSQAAAPVAADRGRGGQAPRPTGAGRVVRSVAGGRRGGRSLARRLRDRLPAGGPRPRGRRAPTTPSAGRLRPCA